MSGSCLSPIYALRIADSGSPDVETGAAFDTDRIFEAQREFGIMRAQLVRKFMLKVGFAMDDRATFAQRRQHRLDLDHTPPPLFNAVSLAGRDTNGEADHLKPPAPSPIAVRGAPPPQGRSEAQHSWPTRLRGLHFSRLD